MKETDKKLQHFLDAKQSMVQMSKAQNQGMPLPKFKNYAGSRIKWNKATPFDFLFGDKAYTFYLFEVQVIDTEIKHLKHRIKMLAERKRNLMQKKDRLETKMQSVCFGSRKLMKAQNTKEEYIQNHEQWKRDFHSRRNHTMVIPGRSQGKYCNNLFKYHLETMNEDGMADLYYYATSGKIIKLPIRFYLHNDLLKGKLKLKHATPGKSVCYILENHEEYSLCAPGGCHYKGYHGIAC